jgi:hypothetical protein
LSLPTFLLKELKVWRLACPHSPYDLVFPNLNGQPMSHTNLLARGFFPALKRAHLRKIRFHDLRHTFASLMIANGEDIVRVSRLMGHANASITLNVYSHMLPREHDPSGDRLGVWKQNGNGAPRASRRGVTGGRKLQQIMTLNGGQGRNRTTDTRIFSPSHQSLCL